MSNIDEMQAGKELDDLIAERVMGWTEPDGISWQDENGIRQIQAFSTKISAAWQVWQKIINMDADYPSNFVEHLCGGEPEMYHQWDGFNVVCFVESVLKDINPLAICKAALFAMEKGP